MELHGSAVVSFLGGSYPAQMTVSLDTGQIVLIFERGVPPMPLEQLAILSDKPSLVGLSQIELGSPLGKLRLSKFDNFFVVQHEPSCASAHNSSDSLLVTSTADVTRLTLQPRGSLMTFEYVPSISDATSGVETVLAVAMNSQSMNMELNVGSQTVGAKFEGSKLILKSAASLSSSKDALLCSFGLLFGGPASVRSTRTDHNLSIDVVAHSHGSIEHLWLRQDDVKEMFQRFLDMFASAQSEERRRLVRAATLHLHGLGDKVLLDQKILTLYTSLEVLDDNRTLTKESVSKVLNLTIDQAEIVCRVRHALAHSGSSISEAVISARQDYAYKSGRPLVDLGFEIDEVARSKTSSRYFFWLASKLNQYWLRRSGFVGQPNDYAHLIS